MPVHPTVAHWELWERLIEQQGVVINQPVGSRHPRYEDMLYEYDYGYIPGTRAADGGAVDVFRGRDATGLVGVIPMIHQPSGVPDPKLLIDMTREDAAAIMAFLDRGSPGPTLSLIWRDRE